MLQFFRGFHGFVTVFKVFLTSFSGQLRQGRLVVWLENKVDKSKPHWDPEEGQVVTDEAHLQAGGHNMVEICRGSKGYIGYMFSVPILG